MSSVRVLIATTALVAVSLACASDSSGTPSAGWPWGTDSVTPADLAKELAKDSRSGKPVVVCVAPPLLYRSGHIPGAVLHGPAFSSEGLNSLTTWAQSLPRSTNIVIYCGCCPLSDCPNLGPAYKALKGLGFTRVRVLLIPDSFKADWIDRGYPIER